MSRYGHSVTFFPDGETNIPNQTPVPGVRPGQVPAGQPQPGTYDQPGAHGQQAAGPSVPSRQADPQFRKAIVRTSMINGVVLVAAVLLAYVFPITHNHQLSTFIIVGAALFTGAHLLIVMQSHQRRQRAQQQASGAQPASPYGSPQPASPYGSQHPYGVPTGGAFSMTVEDIFTITGRGTVVTGRVQAGELHIGQYVVIQRGTEMLAEVEVTGIEMFSKTSDVARAGENVGLLLAGIGRDDLQRGDILSR